jgi:hypothetical protein
MLHFKAEVRMHPQLAMAYALQVIEQAYADSGVFDVWITSGNDSAHKQGSLHYVDRALDFRLSNIPVYSRSSVVARIRGLLTPTFDVLWEDAGESNEHLHVEYDPEKEG